MASTQASKYDMRVNPVYQIDFQNVAAGKTVSATKRRVRWRFGFSNKEALLDGKVGTDCRGEEHEINLVWSLTSGKRQVYADGNEVHFSTGRRTDPSFETSWTMKGGHILKIVAYAAPPLFSTVPGFRQFDLLLDGFSYFDMPKIYELGRPARGAAGARAQAMMPHAHSEQRHYSYDGGSPSRGRGDYGEEVDYQQSKRRTFPERDARAEDTSRSETETTEPSSSSSIDILSSTAAESDLLDATAPTLLSGPVATMDEFAPVEVPAHTPPQGLAFQAVSHQILSQYGPSTAAPSSSAAAGEVLALANESHTHYYGAAPPSSTPAAYGYPPQQQHQYPPQTPPASQQQSPSSWYYPNQTTQQPPSYPSYAAPAPVSPESATSNWDEGAQSPPHHPVVTLTMQPLSLEEMEEQARPSQSEMEKAMHSLVNLDDISEKIVTPEQKKAQVKKQQNQPLRSKAAPPKAPVWHQGPQAKIGDIQKHNPQKAAPTKEVMRTHAFDAAAAHAGMMVVYGAPSTIPDAPGFGAGAAAWAHQQQQQQAYAFQMQQQQILYQRQQQPTYAAY